MVVATRQRSTTKNSARCWKLTTAALGGAVKEFAEIATGNCALADVRER
jgi:hypothetical protein